ncbi:MAG: phage Gp37/Gp68 family protein [Magnetococcales bacterium]|nr:phage Gp37/Gp68 family protein [Magnetococcales bacterium]
MGKDSKIEWTHHTFNPWWGCTRASAGCANCYAEVWAKRVGVDLWGKEAPRRFFGDSHWHNPLRWQTDALRTQQRQRVFCASMADVFESRSDLDPWRARLWDLIQKTPNLDWLLVSKRPEEAAKLTPWGSKWPQNVWMGTTVETQEWAEKRIEAILDVPAKIRFVSCEPLLGPLDLTPWLGDGQIDWVIAGGESGARARPMQAAWVSGLYKQCLERTTSFFFKQWGVFGEDGIRRNKKSNGKTLMGQELQAFPALSWAST